ncbi:MAG: hypothetical protein HW412_2198 [Bacteroidetes bacterium]|nr:hypothetical protein [Bacteroidota bacterium]
MPTARIKPLLFVIGALLPVSCATSLFSSFSYEDVSEARAFEQTTFEDSAKVFFATYPNPYPDKSFLWFAVFTEGAVEMHVHDSESDSLRFIYRFERQDVPVHTVAFHENRDHLVKCILFVDGRKKCAKLYPSWSAIQIPQFKTKYTIESR